MKSVSVYAAAGLGVLLSLAQPAEAGRRITCQCQGQAKTWIHHNYACEYYFEKPFAKSSSGGSKRPVKSCTAKEYTRFHKELCAKDSCTLKE